MTRPVNIKAYAQSIVEDERWTVLQNMLEQEYFIQWRGEKDAEKRNDLYAEYLGFTRFSSKLKALAINLGDKK